jgi:hypothetical protein
MIQLRKCLSARQLFTVLVAVALVGCERHVQVDGDWKEGESHNQSFSRVLVVGLSHNASGRCDFESYMTTQLRYTGIDAKSSCMLMSTSEPLNEEHVDAAIAEYGADAVLATVLVQSDQDTKVGGDYETRGGLDFKAQGTGYAHSYYRGGYGRWGVPVVYGQFKEAPVLTTIAGEVELYSMLFSTHDEALVYELTTTANDLSSRDNALATVTPPIAEQLQRDGLLGNAR